MALLYNQKTQNDVLTELLEVCGLTIISIKILDRKNLKSREELTFKSKKIGPALQAELFASSIVVRWSVKCANTHPFFENLPRSYYWKGAENILLFIDLLNIEVSNIKAGNKLILQSVAMSLFVLCIRDFVEKLSDFRSPIKSPPIFKAIQLIHSAPSYNWNIVTLAKEVGESKSSFNRKFKSFVGISAHKYIRNWRITIAQKRLLSEDITLDILAEDLGFSGQAALSKAFKEVTGIYPKKWITTTKNL